MLVTNTTQNDYWFGPLRLAAGAINVSIDDTTETSLYLTDDTVADALNALYTAGKITVASQAQPFPRATGVPSVFHGDGSPEGLVYGPQGSIYLRRDSTNPSLTIYAKTSGVTTSTGWSAFGDIPFTVGTSFPTAPAAGSACALNTGQSFLTFVYDGTHWYTQPILAVQGLSGNTQSATVVRINVANYPIYISDATAAGCTVQMRIDTQQLVDNNNGDAGRTQAGYATASNGANGWGSDNFIAATEIADAAGSLPGKLHVGAWGDGPTSGDLLLPLLGGLLDGGGDGTEIQDVKTSTIWIRYKK